MSIITAGAIDSVVARILHPGSAKYTSAFNPTVDGWAASASGFLDTLPGGLGALGLTVTAHHDLTTLRVQNNANTVVSRVVTGLTVGREYDFVAWVMDSNPGFAPTQTSSVGVAGIGATVPDGAVGPQRKSYRFVATAASHTLQISFVKTGIYSIVGAISDVHLYERPYELDSFPLSVIEGELELDPDRAPYAEARLTLSLPSDADLAQLTTRTSNEVRIQIETSQQFIEPAAATATRSWDLLLHRREADFNAGHVTIVCHSDEARLIDAGNDTAADDERAVLDQTSLRAIIQTILERYYAELEPGTDDADLTLTVAVDNLIRNPNFETNTDYTDVGTGASSRTWSAAQAKYGTRSCRWTAAAGDSNLAFTPGAAGGDYFPVTPGEVYTFSFYLRSTVARNAKAMLRFYTGNGTGTATDFSGTVVATDTGAWTRYDVQATAPAGVTTMRPYAMTTGNASGNQHYVDGVMLTKGATLWPYFDGDSVTDAYYDYVWSGAAHASTSSRVRLDDRDPRLLIEDPGEKHWDFLQQMVQAAGLRLFCDEEQLWRLVDRATYTPAGVIELDETTNVRRAREVDSREDGGWADAIVVRYSWIDQLGAPQIAYDAASLGGSKLDRVDWNRPYPGSGAAASVLARRQQLGRLQELEATPDLAAKPGMALSTSLPHTPAQEGTAGRIEYVYPEDGPAVMSITARDLEDA